MKPFRTHPDGIRVRLSPDEIEALRMLPELLASVGTTDSDPAGERLDVAVYRDDADAAEEFGRLMASEMTAGRDADRSAFTAALDAMSDSPVIISHEEAEAWLMVLGEARLALAARLGIEEDGWREDSGRAHEPGMALLHYLSWLQGSLVTVLMGRL